jgi:signal peptidase I
LDNFQPQSADTSSELVEAQQSYPFRKALYDVLETVVLALIMIVVINLLTARIRVDGFSMEPSFHNDEYIIVSKLAYKLGDISRGDVIVFRFPRNPEEDYIKRVIGLPGDHVVIQDGVVYVNNVALVEPYIAAPPIREVDEFVPEGNLYVMGDNRNDSSDSRTWGPLPIENVIGKAWLVYWPFSDAGFVEHVAHADLSQ